jgi:hypothetical protein
VPPSETSRQPDPSGGHCRLMPRFYLDIHNREGGDRGGGGRRSPSVLQSFGTGPPLGDDRCSAASDRRKSRPEGPIEIADQAGNSLMKTPFSDAVLVLV